MIKLKNIKRTEEWIEAMFMEEFYGKRPEVWGYMKLRLSDGELLEFRRGNGGAGVSKHALYDLSKLEKVPETYKCIYY